MVFVLREPGRMSIIPVVSTFSLAAHEKEMPVRVMFRWLANHRYMAEEEEWEDVMKILDISQDDPLVLFPFMKTMTRRAGRFSRALTHLLQSIGI